MDSKYDPLDDDIEITLDEEDEEDMEIDFVPEEDEKSTAYFNLQVKYDLRRISITEIIENVQAIIDQGGEFGDCTEAEIHFSKTPILDMLNK